MKYYYQFIYFVQKLAASPDVLILFKYLDTKLVIEQH